jgi:hypothetical protein
MEYANGPEFDYLAPEDRHRDLYGDRVHERGLYTYEKARILEAFYDQDYAVYERGVMAVENEKGQISKVEHSNNDLMRIMKMELDGAIHVGLRWIDAEEGCAEESCTVEVKDAFHAVVVTDVVPGRVYYRNPHGPSAHAQGTELNSDGPPRRIEDPAIGLESMAYSEFRERITNVVSPKAPQEAEEVGVMSSIVDTLRDFVGK